MLIDYLSPCLILIDMLSPEILEIFAIQGFIASICIVVLLVIEANVLIRLLPLIKRSADNTSRVAETFEHGEDMIKKLAPRVLDKYPITENYLINCPDFKNPNHIHTKSCLP